MRVRLSLVALPLVLVACTSRDRVVAELFSEDARWVDLTYPFNSATIYWPTAQGFQLEKVADGETEAGYYYAANNFRAAEHGGTHLDAPVHFARGKHTADQIPLAQLMGSAVVVDVSVKAAQNPDYQVTVERSALDQTIVRPDSSLPAPSRTDAASCAVSPTFTDTESGKTTT
ncbi:MAG: cyclase family protein, partial [Gemmatimonadetes bacterium]|nr:cyclase family protein [Gemmatimonadota bacterium]